MDLIFGSGFLSHYSCTAMETAFRVLNHIHRKGYTYVCQAALLPGKVTHLVLRRPDNFHFNPGDYIFLNIPSIAKYEWHPFTLSSAPEMHGFLSVHIHSVGQWTNRLYDIFSSMTYKKNIRSASLAPKIARSSLPPMKPRIRSQSQHVQKLKSKDLKKLTTTSNWNRKMGVDNMFHEHVGKGRYDGAFTITEETDNEMMEEKSDKVHFDMEIKELKEPKDLTTTSSLNRKLGVDNIFHKNVGEGRYNEAFTIKDETDKEMMEEKSEKVHLDMELKELKDFHQRFSLANSKVIQLAECQISNNNAEQLQQLSTIMEGKKQFKSLESMPVSIVGPYGSPSSQIFRAEHAVLIGTGIGITPFASILQSIIYRYNEVRSRCPKCDHYWLDHAPSSIMSLKKVDFFWINRNHKALEWFSSLLKQLELEQSEYPSPKDNRQFFDFYIYITSLVKKDNLSATFLQMALDLMHQKSKKDITTGLKTKALPGRPNWDQIFDNIQKKKAGKVTVFFCGRPELGRILRNKCNLRGFTFCKEKF
ncbi:NADPH oxidase 5 [Nymphon striatum]|nr:NADPH oxidase 5 [Nymphon striatum]